MMKSKFVSIHFLIAVIFFSACTHAETLVDIQTTLPSNTAISPTTTNIVQSSPTTKIYETVKLTMNQSKLPSYGPIFIAEKEGYFAEFGIEMNYVTFNKASDALPLIISGDLDVYATYLSGGLLNVLGHEPNVKVVADRGSISKGDCTYMAILVRKDLFDSGKITSAIDLKGKKIIGNPTGSTGFLLSKYLESAGLTTKDVDLSDIPTAGYVDVFNNPDVVAISVPELYISRILKTGNAAILATAQDVLGATQLNVLAFGKSLVVDHPEFGARFLAAYLKGVQKYNEGKTESNLQILANATGEDISLLKDSCWVPVREDGSIIFSGVDVFQQWSLEQKLLDVPVTEGQFWDPSFLVAAKKLLGQ